MERKYSAGNESSNCPIPCADGDAAWRRTPAKPVHWRILLLGAAMVPTDKCPAVLGGCGGWAGCATPPRHCLFSPTTWRRTRNEVATTGCPATCCARRRWHPRCGCLHLECPRSVTKYPWLPVHSGTSVDLCSCNYRSLSHNWWLKSRYQQDVALFNNTYRPKRAENSNLVGLPQSKETSLATDKPNK